MLIRHNLWFVSHYVSPTSNSTAVLNVCKEFVDLSLPVTGRPLRRAANKGIEGHPDMVKSQVDFAHCRRPLLNMVHTVVSLQHMS